MSDSPKWSPRLTLSKWYLDLVSPEGHAFLGYFGEISWRGVTLRIESNLDAPLDATCRTRSRWTRQRGPCEERDGSLSWSSRGLGLEGRWKPLLPAVPRRLSGQESGGVDWDCRAPLAEGTVRFSGGSAIEGFGYVDRLSLTLAPWQLPVEELRWGRFAAPHGSVVWIDWRGPFPLRLVLMNGVEMPGASIWDDGVGLKNGSEVRFGRRRVLRSGRPLMAMAGEVPGLSAFLPDSLRGIQEEKWLCPGTLYASDGATSEGWVVHELVRFGREKI